MCFLTATSRPLPLTCRSPSPVAEFAASIQVDGTPQRSRPGHFHEPNIGNHTPQMIRKGLEGGHPLEPLAVAASRLLLRQDRVQSVLQLFHEVLWKAQRGHVDVGGGRQVLFEEVSLDEFELGELFVGVVVVLLVVVVVVLLLDDPQGFCGAEGGLVPRRGQLDSRGLFDDVVELKNDLAHQFSRPRPQIEKVSLL